MRLALVLVLTWLCGPAQALSISFINPGRSDELYWISASQAMQAAARSLNIQLEVLYAERDPEQALALGRQIAARPPAQRPDYVVLVNEKGTLVPNARVLGEAGIKSFAAFSGLLPQERRRWAPRRGLPLLLGSLEPDAEQAGYLSAKALIDEGLRRGLAGPDGRLHLLAIAGDRSTPVSIRRNEGLRRALKEQAARAELDEQVFADWRLERAAELTPPLLRRHPQARLIWAGSDQMAFGAMQALEPEGRREELLFSAINNSLPALQALQEGRLSAVVGGHFIAGAWALVMLYDHHHGLDFAAEGLEQERPMFMLFGQAEARQYLARFAPGMPALDFRPYSKKLNPGLGRYRFETRPLLLP
ncbi:substrate-binding domain-containing protein [Roseateles sp. DAIF2]|uniref:ABC transporter substrate-binding protein n=1 Tax=Roseateles sp. DAIF2 TaxID=2714952 RepID=UPI0018A2DBCD|nr:ABC transporter substrate-binding protein [Roseateles sp. DAIF2]QPF75069.1 substrate-binding domain-containing protein [Roseateles sp. DAIF2]